MNIKLTLVFVCGITFLLLTFLRDVVDYQNFVINTRKNIDMICQLLANCHRVQEL